jgi:hydroxyethylthiazole kinase-like uncharacterized protein yjeF
MNKAHDQTVFPASMSVLGGSEMRELDRLSIESGTPSLELMERAGEGIAELLESGAVAAGSARLAATIECDRSLLILSGSGNNGGDGFVVARALSALGWLVQVVLVAERPDPSSDAAACLQAWEQTDATVVEFQAIEELVAIVENWDGELILDCIFGTGLSRDIAPDMVKAFDRINDMDRVIVACDLPSGLSADTGRVLGGALRAEATISLGAAKVGSFLADGADVGGAVFVVDIGLAAPEEVAVPTHGFATSHDWASSVMPRRRRGFHKGEGGHLLIVAGAAGKSGAAHLAARAALRAGCGLVTVACTAPVAAALANSLPEAMTILLPNDDAGALHEDALSDRRLRTQGYDAVVFGPGTGTGPGASAVLEELIEHTACPLVLDADALNLLAENKTELLPALRDRNVTQRRETVITPHPGEMARLIGESSVAVQANRAGLAQALAQELAATVVLKGAATIVASTRQTAWNTTGNPAMASAGMGDVLAGLTGALLARGLEADTAAALAAWWHGRAADLLLAETRAPGFLASEVADGLVRAAAEFQG